MAMGALAAAMAAGGGGESPLERDGGGGLVVCARGVGEIGSEEGGKEGGGTNGGETMQCSGILISRGGGGCALEMFPRLVLRHLSNNC